MMMTKMKRTRINQIWRNKQKRDFSLFVSLFENIICTVAQTWVAQTWVAQKWVAIASSGKEYLPDNKTVYTAGSTMSKMNLQIQIKTYGIGED